jgi:hypothetical protein
MRSGFRPGAIFRKISAPTHGVRDDSNDEKAVGESGASVAEWMSSHGFAILKVTLGVLLVWVGFQQVCPGLCDVEVLAGKTLHVLALGLIPIKACAWVLAMLE